jgi:RasGEF N-terminal motif
MDSVFVPTSLSPTTERQSIDSNDSSSPSALRRTKKPGSLAYSPPSRAAVHPSNIKDPNEKPRGVGNASSSGVASGSALLQTVSEDHSPDLGLPTGPLSTLLQPPEIYEGSRSLHIPGSYASPDLVTSTPGSIYSTNYLPATNNTGRLPSAAVPDTERVLPGPANGTVDAGTLDGLVDRLLKESQDRAKDDQVKRIFLAIYRLFTTDENLFKILKRRFEEMGVSDAPNRFVLSESIPHRCVLCSQSDPDFLMCRSSILLFLRSWLQEDVENMGRELLTSIRQFANSMASSDIMNSVAQEIVNLVDEKVCASGDGHSACIG